jgi:hypothetical protein
MIDDTENIEKEVEHNVPQAADANESVVNPEFEKALADLNDNLHRASARLSADAFDDIAGYWRQISSAIGEDLKSFLKQVGENPENDFTRQAVEVLDNIERILDKVEEEALKSQEKALEKALFDWFSFHEVLLEKIPAEFKREIDINELTARSGDEKSLRKARRKKRIIRSLGGAKSVNIPFRSIVMHYHIVVQKRGLQKVLGQINADTLQVVNDLRKEVNRQLVLIHQWMHQEENQSGKIVSERITHFEHNLSEILVKAEAIAINGGQELKRHIDIMCEKIQSLGSRLDVRWQVKDRKKRLNTEALGLLEQRLRSFPQSWNVNQVILANHLKAELWFGRVSIGVFGQVIRSEKTVNENYLKPVLDNLMVFKTQLSQAEKALSDRDRLSTVSSDQLNEHIFLNPELLLSRFEHAIEELTKKLPEQFSLINTQHELTELSFTRKLPVIIIAMSRVADFLIDMNFSEPHQHMLLEVTSKLNRLNGKILNSANLLTYAAEMASESESSRELSEVLDKSKETFELVEKEIKLVEESFESHLITVLNSTLSSLDLKSVVSRADQLTSTVSKKRDDSGLKKWINKRFERVIHFKDRLLRLVKSRRRDAMLVRHEIKYADLINDGERVLDFLEQIKLPSALDEKIPYYYKQLFSGKHLSNSAGISLRQNEIVQARKAVIRMKAGSGGAIAVTGDALTGKTFLVDYIANNLLSGKVVRVNPPPGGSHETTELYNAMAKALGDPTGTIRRFLNTIEPGTVFVFNDIEQWWLRNPDGLEAIRALVKLITRFSNRHYFILSSNNESFRVISAHSGLKELLLTTIVIAPSTMEEMRNIIWMRHQTGGLLLESDTRQAEGLNSRRYEGLMRRFHRKSHGNVGLALRFWLQSIRHFENDTIWLSSAPLPGFPDINNSDWKVILYQLYLHRSLSFDRLKVIFEDEGDPWLRQNLSGLKRAKLVDELNRDVFGLSSDCRPYVEQYFRDIHLIS